ncbi:hypothetical protein [Citrobacter freundii]|uniref:hypothetical protein n=1 Tax=Citrobacter freundii TaxID=546 RepID=UPI0028EB7570|nr:hypothetical protein [Citrobacter freundii]WNT10006.1 hypothetical protein RRL16_26175 [Citrobacter freundii]HCL6023502.1 hypothetical protein [Citrobacter freundii]
MQNVTPRAGIVQAQRIARAAFNQRVTQPVRSFQQWELAANLMRLATLAAQMTQEPAR